MTKLKRFERYQIFILPGIFASVLIIPTLNSWFGLADDHLFAEAIHSTNGTFNAILKFYFNLQPWANSPRFNPSELFGWALETYLFSLNALGWRVTQLIALSATSITVGVSIRRIGRYLGYSTYKISIWTLAGQGMVLAMPFWSETIGRIGAPETFASVSLSFLFLNVVNLISQRRIVLNLYWLSLNTIILVGFKENLIVIGFCSMIFQIFYLLNANHLNKKPLFFSLILQSIYITYVIVGFLPTLLDSGQVINGAGIGLSRILITKWIIIPIFSLSILIIAFAVYRNQLKSRFIQANLMIFLLILIEYFVMAGKLGGHYGFLSSILLTIQLLLFLNKRIFDKTVIGIILVFSILGISFNVSNTLGYLNRTNMFKQEINNLIIIIQKHDLTDVVIQVTSLEEYEAVSSITSFTQNRSFKFYLQVADTLPEGLLKENLLKYSKFGFKEWHLEPLAEWQNKDACVLIEFSSEFQNESCRYNQKISWLSD